MPASESTSSYWVRITEDRDKGKSQKPGEKPAKYLLRTAAQAGKGGSAAFKTFSISNYVKDDAIK